VRKNDREFLFVLGFWSIPKLFYIIHSHIIL
jgi:hypothetical protein